MKNAPDSRRDSLLVAATYRGWLSKVHFRHNAAVPGLKFVLKWPDTLKLAWAHPYK